ncbi:MAG: glycine cleavage system protein GcvH, partial [Steroidobacteraceae bacterium]
MSSHSDNPVPDDIPDDLQYTRTHEWVRELPGGELELGITDHAQRALGDLVFVEAPQPGRRVRAGDSCGVVESVKAASDVSSPIEGEITAANAALASAPERINQDPYHGGWIARIRPAPEADRSVLLSAAQY